MGGNIQTGNGAVKSSSPGATLAAVATVEDGVRRTIARWMAARGVTKTALGAAADRNQPWVTRYLDGEFGADVATLAKIAAFFGEPLAALFEAQPDPEVNELVQRFRATTPPRRALVLELLREWVPDEVTKLERGGRPRTRERGGGSGGAAQG